MRRLLPKLALPALLCLCLVAVGGCSALQPTNPQAAIAQGRTPPGSLIHSRTWIDHPRRLDMPEIEIQNVGSTSVRSAIITEMRAREYELLRGGPEEMVFIPKRDGNNETGLIPLRPLGSMQRIVFIGTFETEDGMLVRAIPGYFSQLESGCCFVDLKNTEYSLELQAVLDQIALESREAAEEARQAAKERPFGPIGKSWD